VSIESQRVLKVLIVEDMLTIRLLLSGLIKTVLRTFEPIITSAEDGVQGLEAVLRYHPDLVITDITMPQMDGLELCRRIKSDPEIARVPVVMMTSSPEHREAGLAAGAAAFLNKPIRDKDLADALSVALAKVHPGPHG
jgi:two-component system cell cycle response regulator